jgi:hypothetical protein
MGLGALAVSIYASHEQVDYIQLWRTRQHSLRQASCRLIVLFLFPFTRGNHYVCRCPAADAITTVSAILALHITDSKSKL